MQKWTGGVRKHVQARRASKLVRQREYFAAGRHARHDRTGGTVWSSGHNVRRTREVAQREASPPGDDQGRGRRLSKHSGRLSLDLRFLRASDGPQQASNTASDCHSSGKGYLRSMDGPPDTRCGVVKTAGGREQNGHGPDGRALPVAGRPAVPSQEDVIRRTCETDTGVPRMRLIEAGSSDSADTGVRHIALDYLPFLDCRKEDDNEQRRGLDEEFEWGMIRAPMGQWSQFFRASSAPSSRSRGTHCDGSASDDCVRPETHSLPSATAITGQRRSDAEAPSVPWPPPRLHPPTTLALSLPARSTGDGSDDDDGAAVVTDESPCTRSCDVNVVADGEEKHDTRLALLRRRYERLKQEARKYRRAVARLRRERDEARQVVLMLKKQAGKPHCRCLPMW